MADTFKFPNGGYGVIVVRKEDILSSIEGNILDKEIALDIIKQLETDAANLLSEGKWVGIPFMGNIRIPVERQILDSEENRELLKEAKELLPTEDFVMFRKKLAGKAFEKAKHERFYKYILSQAITKNRKLWLKWCEEYGQTRANIMVYNCTKLKEARGNEYYYKT